MMHILTRSVKDHGPVVEGILDRARERYRSLRASERPPLDQPANALALFPRLDLHRLSQRGLWPLPRSIRRWLMTDPEAERNRLRAELADLLADDLPAAVAALVRDCLARNGKGAR